MQTGTKATKTAEAATEIAKQYLLDSAQGTACAAHECATAIVAAAQLIAESLRREGKLLICGNGGSAADSQHLAGEFVNVLDRRRLRPAMPAIALTTDTSILTAIANDLGYAAVFARQIESLGRPGDVVLGISTSGNSENVECAFQTARRNQMKTIALVGAGGRLPQLADMAICIPSDSTKHVQETHVAVEHLLCLLTEIELFGPGDQCA